MKIINYTCVLLITLPIHGHSSNSKFDATIVGEIKFAEGLKGHASNFIHCLKDILKVNYICTGCQDFTDMPQDIKKIVVDPNKTPGNVAVFTNVLWATSIFKNTLDYIPNSHIKIAYSVFEATLIPKKWTEILNSKFDAVAVADNYLVEVYKNSGVLIPIFVLPYSVYLDDLLIKSKKNKPENTPFTFGISAGFGPDKNHELLLDAFVKEFGDSPAVKLKIHGRGYPNNMTLTNLIKKLKEYQLSNVDISCKYMNRNDYVNFLASLDCYVLLSRGEGFSITPREALALGIPCIISNNTAHKTICSTGFVKAVESNIPHPADYFYFGKYEGHKFNSTLEDACKALRDVYDNYQIYLEKAKRGQEWVQQYSHENLKLKYASLIKPKKIILAEKNIIENDYLMTNSEVLYNKYQEILAQ